MIAAWSTWSSCQNTCVCVHHEGERCDTLMASENDDDRVYLFDVVNVTSNLQASFIFVLV